MKLREFVYLKQLWREEHGYGGFEPGWHHFLFILFEMLLVYLFLYNMFLFVFFMKIQFRSIFAECVLRNNQTYKKKSSFLAVRWDFGSYIGKKTERICPGILP